MADALAVGDRVCDNEEHRGTVRYVGPVATSKSQDTVYAGIEWDSSERGKNDGSVTLPSGEVVRYFTCVRGAGSFLKVELVRRGRPLDECLRARYLDATPSPATSLTGLSGKEVPITLVGDGKVRAAQTLEKLTAATLRYERVSSVPPGSVAMCTRLRELDLRGNLLSRWESVAALGAQLPSLSMLDLSENRMAELTLDGAARFAGCLAKLATLIVNETRVGWRDLVHVHVLAPNLRELHACSNSIKTLGGELDSALVAQATQYPSLRVLNLSDNRLQSWEDVQATLGSLPALAWLLLSNNQLSRIRYPRETIPQCFPVLEQLSISGNSLVDMASLDALDEFPALTNLRISNSDLACAVGADRSQLEPASADSVVDVSPSEARQIVIARLPKLGSLNNSEVRPREREDAEKAYAKRMLGAFLRSRGATTVSDVFPAHSVAPPSDGELRGPASAAACAAVPEGVRSSTDSGVIRSKRADAHVTVQSAFPLAAVSGASTPRYACELDPFGLGAAVPDASAILQRFHPRYFLAAARFDLHAPVTKDAASASSIAASVVGVTLRPMSGNACMLDPVRKKLPTSMTVGDVKIMVERLFKCDPALQRLSFRDSPASYPSLLDDDSKSIGYYAVTDGGDVLIEEVDPIQLQKQADMDRRAKEAKMAAQAATGDALRRAQEISVHATRAAVVSSATAAAKPDDDKI